MGSKKEWEVEEILKTANSIQEDFSIWSSGNSLAWRKTCQLDFEAIWIQTLHHYFKLQQF